jgi:hypothetical protein
MQWLQRGSVLLFLLLAARALAAESPEEVLRAFVATMQKDGVPAALARYTHPDEAARYKSLFMSRIREGFVLGDTFSKDLLGESLRLRQIESMPPAEFLAKTMWRVQMAGTDVKPLRILGSRKDGGIAILETLTEYTDLQGAPAQKRDFVRFKAFGDTWRMMISPEMDAYAIVLIAK